MDADRAARALQQGRPLRLHRRRGGDRPPIRIPRASGLQVQTRGRVRGREGDRARDLSHVLGRGRLRPLFDQARGRRERLPGDQARQLAEPGTGEPRQRGIPGQRSRARMHREGDRRVHGGRRAEDPGRRDRPPQGPRLAAGRWHGGLKLALYQGAARRPKRVALPRRRLLGFRRVGSGRAGHRLDGGFLGQVRG